MRDIKPAILLLSGFVTWGGSALARDTAQPSAPRFLSLKIQWTAAAKCLVSSRERTFVLPEQKTKLRDYLKGVSASKDAIHLSGDVRYECLTQVLAAAKKSGIKSLGFISEPPTPF